MNFHLIIPSAGIGKRFKAKIPKQFYKIEGKEILAITISKFHSIRNLKNIIISARKEYFKKIYSLIKKYNFYKVTQVVEGGNTRQDSVFNALSYIKCDKYDFIAVHDAVRPFVKSKFIEFVFSNAVKYKAVVPCVKINDTVKLKGKNNYVEKTLDRDYIYIAQTPQVFRFDILKKSYDYSRKQKIMGTDDASLVENAGYKVKIIDGDLSNIKITTIGDLNFISL
ncbi:MAG: 2-C-methyl-D-erythritol 4-phosphate cytidylyltransferase [Ignavibacteria bacterium]|nr:2-C-methyl-D-erythritol 4-phosphate cytidylyltransferase [Ignavibacteria bacterium]